MSVKNSKTPLGLVYFVCMSFAYITIGAIFVFTSSPENVSGHIEGRIIVGIILLACGISRGLWGWNLIRSEKEARLSASELPERHHSYME